MQGREAGLAGVDVRQHGRLASPVFAVFGWYEVRRQRAGADPLVVPALFRRRAFTGGLAAGVAYFAAMMGFNLAFSLYLQLGLGYSPLRTGLASVPAAAGVIAGFGIAMAGGLAQRHGRAVMRGGLAVMAAASVGFAVIVHGARAAPGIWSLVPALAGYGVGMGLVMAPFFDIILAGVRRRRAVRRPARSTPSSSSPARSASPRSARCSSTSPVSRPGSRSCCGPASGCWR